MHKCYCDTCGQEIPVRDFEEMSDNVRFKDKYDLCTSCFEKTNFKDYEAAKKAFFLDYCKTHAKKTRKPAKSIPAYLEQALDDQAERAMANLGHAHAVRKCRKGGAVATVCKCGGHGHKLAENAGKCGKKTEKTVKTGKKAAKTTTMKQLSEELGVNYKAMKTYAYRNDLGVVVRRPHGNKTRELSPADVDAIREHFGK